MRIGWLLLAIACKTNDKQQAEIVVRGGTIHIDVGSTTDAMAIQDGRIVALGADALAMAGTGTAMVDVTGKHVFAGFHDAHTHLLPGNFALDRMLLLGVSSMESAANVVANYADSAPIDEPWLVGYGWLSENIPEPDGRPLTEVVPDRPVILVSNSGHEAIVNQFVLDLVGINSETPDPPDGYIGRDPDTGEPTGYLVEGAVTPVAERMLLDYDDERLSGGLADRMLDFSYTGLTGISEILAAPGFDIGRPWIYTELEAAGQLPMRVTWYAPIFAAADLDGVDQLREEYPGDLVHFGGAKLWVDGSMGSAEAWMEDEYPGNPGSYGTHYLELDEMMAIVRKAEELGISLKVHANGDAAVGMALDAFEAVANENGGLNLTHVMEHLCLMDLDDLARLQTLGLVASIQPTHVVPASLGETAQYLGERFDDAYDFPALLDAGVPLALGTDWPVWPSADPILVTWSATKLEDRALPVAEAMRAYTEGGAAAIGRSDELGRLDVGYLADFVVLDQNPLTSGVDAIPDISVEQVWVNGRKVQ